MEENILKGKSLLIVDDEADLRDILASELEFMGARVFQVGNIQAAQTILSESEIDLIISDIRMPGGTGIDLLKLVKASGKDAPPMILITGFADITIEDAFNMGAEALMSKPFKLDDLIKMVARYTSGFDDRFKEELNPSRKIELADIRDIRVGRGGFALSVSSSHQKITVGESLEFSVDYRGHQLEGAGVCRWLRSGEPGSNKIYLGMEFMKLSETSIKALHTLFDDRQGIAYIPAL